MRRIDADAIMEALNIFNDKENGNAHFLNGIETAKEIIADAPTIEAEPVRRGRWLPHPMEKDWSVCSACGQGTEIVRHEAGATREYNYKHCPWCGAKMER